MISQPLQDLCRSGLHVEKVTSNSECDAHSVQSVLTISDRVWMMLKHDSRTRCLNCGRGILAW
eukprot:1140559-Amphidinium_carterae.1